VLAVNQDPLGKPAGRVAQRDETQVWARPLEDGTKAVGLFNLGEDEQDVTVSWSELGLNGAQPVRDLWRQQDLGTKDGGYTVKVPRHGAALIRVGQPGK
jgi:alpha-galactosidase